MTFFTFERGAKKLQNGSCSRSKFSNCVTPKSMTRSYVFNIMKKSILPIGIFVVVFSCYKSYIVSPVAIAQRAFIGTGFLPKPNQLKNFVTSPYKTKSSTELLNKTNFVKLMPKLRHVGQNSVISRKDWKYKLGFYQEGVLSTVNGRIIWWRARFSDDRLNTRKPLSDIEFIESKDGKIIGQETYLIEW